MRTIKLTLAYDGTDYFGWQSQAGGDRSVQETIEEAIKKITGRRCPLLASGRTDTGVHALGQMATFRTESDLAPEVWLRALNAHLPRDIAILDVCEVPADFHPIRHTVRKRYRYVLFDGPNRNVFHRKHCWNYNKGRLDAEAMHRAAQCLKGEHDFRSFQSSGAERKTSVRTIYEIFVRRGGSEGAQMPELGGQGNDRAGEGSAEGVGECGLGISSCFETIHPISNPQSPIPNPSTPSSPAPAPRSPTPSSDSDWIIVEVEANGFLYNMVRAIVGSLYEVGRGVKPESWIKEVLDAQDRSCAGPNAPAHGLFLVYALTEEEVGER